MNKRTMKKVFPLLKMMSKMQPSERMGVIHFLSHDGCNGIYECIQNGLTNPTLAQEDKRLLQSTLTPQKRRLRKLLEEKDPEKKKRALIQVGDGVGIILEKVVPLLEEYLSRNE